MQSSEQVVNRILDLDQRAERMRVQAREEAETIRRDTARRIAEEKEQLDRRIAERIVQIEAAASKSRNAEIARVREEFAGQAKAVAGVAPDKMARIVESVVSRIRERAE